VDKINFTNYPRNKLEAVDWAKTIESNSFRVGLAFGFLLEHMGHNIRFLDDLNDLTKLIGLKDAGYAEEDFWV